MKTKLITLALATAALGFGTLANAQDGERNGMRPDEPTQQGYRAYQAPDIPQGPQYREQRRQALDQQRAWEEQQQQQRSWAGNGQNWRNGNQQYGANGRWQFAGNPQFRRGGYVPREYRDSRYYVSDWRAHRLNRPPAGYTWVRDDAGDYLLMALATGLIANLVLNSGR